MASRTSRRIPTLPLDYIRIRQLVFKVYNQNLAGGWEKMRDIIGFLPRLPESTVKRLYMILVSTDIPDVSMAPVSDEADLYRRTVSMLHLLQTRSETQRELEESSRHSAEVS